MARYIDADALIKKIFPYDVVDKKCYTINAKTIYEEIQKAPTADVASKSEVEELSGKYEDLKLKYSDLQKDKDELFALVNYEKTEVARGIFAEIDDYIMGTIESSEIRFGFMTLLRVQDYLAELKEKYIGEQNDGTDN